MEDYGYLRTFNPSKEISKEVVLEVIIRHRDALKQARTGELVDVPFEKLSDNQRKRNRVRALNLIISAQREMINISRPIIYFSSSKAWNKKYPEEEQRQEHKFEDEANDYNKLIEWKAFLKFCENAIIQADKTSSLEDDFILTKISQNGEEEEELTQNFYDMLDELENSYEQIYLLMLTNKIVSAGVEEDDEMTYKEKEQEAIRRAVEA